MTDPSQPDLARVEHAGRGPQRALRLVDQGRIDGIHEPPVNLAGCLAQHNDNRRRDEQADDRIGPVPAKRGTSRAQQHRQGSKPVRAGMQPVSDQGRRADLPADPDAVPGDQLVAGEADHRRDANSDQARHRARMRKPCHRLVTSQHRRRGDDEHDHHPGQVLGPPVPVGITARGRAPPGDERDSQRHRRQRVSRIVQRVTEQRDRA